MDKFVRNVATRLVVSIFVFSLIYIPTTRIVNGEFLAAHVPANVKLCAQTRGVCNQTDKCKDAGGECRWKKVDLAMTADMALNEYAVYDNVMTMIKVCWCDINASRTTTAIPTQTGYMLQPSFTGTPSYSPTSSR